MKKYFNGNVSSTVRKRVIGIFLTIVLLVGLTMPAMAEGGGDGDPVGDPPVTTTEGGTEGGTESCT